jgi:hypothetical protein
MPNILPRLLDAVKWQSRDEVSQLYLLLEDWRPVSTQVRGSVPDPDQLVRGMEPDPALDPDPDDDRRIRIQSRLRLRILLSSCKNNKKNLESYYFVTLFDFLSFKNYVYVPSKSSKQKKLC